MATRKEETGGFFSWGNLSSVLDNGAKTIVKADAIAQKINTFGDLDIEKKAKEEQLSNETEAKRLAYQKQLNDSLKGNSSGGFSFDNNTLLWIGGGILAYMLIS